MGSGKLSYIKNAKRKYPYLNGINKMKSLCLWVIDINEETLYILKKIVMKSSMSKTTHNLSRTCFGRGMIIRLARFHMAFKKKL
ncbi:hypothetical protein J2X69_000277 [Algoriphagus sp. 4150]|nr:hypothetical protein [Algoriphagus sp. 4150]